MKFAHELACKFLNAKMKSIGSRFSLEDPEFVFYFSAFRRYVKKSSTKETEGEVSAVLGKEDVEAIRLYGHFCRNMELKLKKAMKRCVDKNSGSVAANKCLRTLYIYPCMRFLKKNWNLTGEEEVKDAILYSKSLQYWFRDSSAIPVLEQSMINNKLLWPYAVYRLFSRGRKHGLRLTSFMDDSSLPVYKRLAEALPMVGPTNLCKLIIRNHAPDPIVMEIIETCLERLNLLSKVPGLAKTLGVLHSLKHKRALTRYAEPEKRSAVYQDLAQKNAMLAGMISSQFGYVLNQAFRHTPQSFCKRMVDKYELPIDLLSVEIRSRFRRRRDVEYEEYPRDCPYLERQQFVEERKLVKKAKRMKLKKMPPGTELKPVPAIVKEPKYGKKRRKAPGTANVPQVTPKGWASKDIKKRMRPAVRARKRVAAKYVSEREQRSFVTCPIFELSKFLEYSVKYEFDIPGKVLSMSDASKR